jgi:hypothetical protein
MRNIKIKTLLFGASVLFLSSCLKSGNMTTDPSVNNNVVELANTGDNVTSSGIAGFYTDLGTVAPGASKSFNINVRYSGGGSAPQDITVTLALDQATLTTYNTANGTTKVVPASTVISIPTTVIIPKGANQTTVEAKVTVSGDFNFNLAYGVPVKITQSSYGILSGNYSSAVYSFGVRNKYDGQYKGMGTLVDAASAGISGRYPMDVFLVTSGATQVQLYDNVIGGIYHSILSGGSTSYYGTFGVVFNFDGATNKVTSVVNAYGQPASSTRSAELDPSGVNTWDPVTKTLKVKYWMNQPSVMAGHRVAFDETFTYVGVR